MPMWDLAVVGGGIVGLATALQATQRWPGCRVVVLEKESGLARHQTGRNSGVIHSGIYYAPGSLKATTCRTGKALLESFCDRYGLPWDRCGKVIVATHEDELPRLDRLHERGLANGVDCVRITIDQLRDLEPHVAGIAALHVRETGIVDYVAVCEQMAALVRERGGDIRTQARVTAIQFRSDAVHLEITGKGQSIAARQLVNCAGLHSDRVARLSGAAPKVRIVPFRGEYFTLRPEAWKLCRNLIYPVPDPAFPFLGVHFTRMISGGVECGPNAVLAFAREGYFKTDWNARDLLETISDPSFVRLSLRHWQMGLGEIWRSWNRAAFVRALQRLVPAITVADLEVAPAGIRAQALGRNGRLIDDFAILRQGRAVHVLNAPSPAATASLAIAEQIVAQL
ncbi:L-2-hydroxyglutarate oxidase [Tuwongella immobilis]|uniref:FAD dependent oxidoreductase domain-containing protein n=1 Tax=Tuwongella immobilis TaxID=692036 RepID=A0A6C2YT33_9BACT|nr:L-2-hydroxyglutarate oxidase [Tuwongella immobilis]VIP04042.1 hydroxyglutarate oxidase : Uncharacterized protein OS=Blastopirellula marina DSM 3645 GN=DSM3645_07750 PE=4 SV=1: DAO [Tuwongella immobilis]VTS05451.1 hydroxyglutarate oxidase : Uncharacterized protein OS=Blastopirellula marina DSM 3645 GN=DSM3645_07750 PE=4 SV=1: DAO [Tuwongella immobilis]